MKLIMTEAEKKAATWAELDNESLGKVVKAAMFGIKHISEEQEKLYYLSAAIILCSAAASANADKFTHTVNGLTIKGNPFGSWKVVITKIEANK